MAASFTRSGASQLLTELAEEASLEKSPNRRKRRSFLLDEGVTKFSTMKARVKTFSTVYWALKPVDVSPVYCARRGWVCLEKDLLQCISCKSYLAGHLPSSSDLELYKKCVEKLKASIFDSHKTSCQWKCSPSPISEFAPEVLDREVVLDYLGNQLEAFVESDCQLKAVSFAPFSLLGLTDKDLTDLMEILKCNNLSRLVMVVSGWTVGEIADTMCCEYCFRTLGLWRFSSENTLEFSSRKPKQALNPEKQHQPWCPWVTPPETVSAVHFEVDGDGSSDDDLTITPRWKAAVRLVLKPQKIKNLEDTSWKQDTSSSMCEYLVLAKQLLEETLANVEYNVERSSVNS